MSTRPSYGPYAGKYGLKRPRGISAGADGARLNWRALQPFFLRSAGVAGLAGMIVAVISSASLSDRAVGPDLELRAEATETAASAPVSETAANPAVALALSEATLESGGTLLALATAASTSAPEFEPAIARAAQAPARPRETSAAAPANEVAQPPIDIASLRPAAAEPTSSLAAAAPAPAEPAGTTERHSPSLWEDEAVHCPRDWVAVQDAAQPEAPVNCASAAPTVPAATHASGEPTLDNVALNLAPDPAVLALAVDSLGSESAVPLPRPRPEPGPNAIKKVASKSRSKWGNLPPPPNCGTKHAYYRYVDKKPVWYCR